MEEREVEKVICEEEVGIASNIVVIVGCLCYRVLTYLPSYAYCVIVIHSR
jgi:hypothetical protein